MYNKTINQFTIELSSNAPTPGGGGASALVGAIAIALGEMVGSLTIGKKKYAQYENELTELQKDAEQIRTNLLEGINDDAKAFEPLSKAYSLPKDDPQRSQKLEQCLKLAANAPLEIMKNICQAITIIHRYGEIGSRLAISDAATGAMIAYGALHGTAINVKVNTKLMKDKEYAEQINNQVEKLLNEYSTIALQTYNSIEKEMH